MLKRLLYKWFGLEELPCSTCEVLREQLAHSEQERRELLNRLLEPPKTEPPPVQEQDLKPITPAFIPWRVRQQMLEQEDKKAAQLLKDKQKEIDNSRISKLEKELDVDGPEIKLRTARESVGSM